MKPGPAPRTDWDSPVWTCTGECKETLPLEDFYRCKTRKNGRVSKCKKCFTVYHDKGNVPRKRMVMSMTPKQDKRTRVIEAIKGGAWSQDQIRIATGLSVDEICDILAGLWDKGRLDRLMLRRGEYRLAA